MENNLVKRILQSFQYSDRREGLALWEVYRVGLNVLADRKLPNSQAGVAMDDKIKPLLEREDGKAQSWEDLYEAEQRLSYYLTDDEIRSEFGRRYAEAQKLGVKSAPDLKAEFDACVKAGKGLQPVYLTLLDEVQFCYVKRSLDRKTRRQTGNNMNRLGFFLLFGTIILMGVWTNDTIGQFLATHYFIVGIWFGAVGAVLSRLISFNSQLADIDYDTLRNGFSNWINVLRIIIGGFSAAIFILLLNGNFISGEMFPDLETIGSRSELGNLPEVSAERAKLLIWAMISGFSERLIPDRFAALAAQQNSKAGTAPAAKPEAPAAKPQAPAAQ